MEKQEGVFVIGIGGGGVTQYWEIHIHIYIAVFGKVYRTIFQSKRQRLVLKTGVIMYIQNYTYENDSNIF